MAIDETTEVEDGIDRASPIPLYHQLEELLRREMDRGTYPPGGSLPSEGEICQLYGVSRSVVRQTLTNLAHAGLIRTERGRGSFVAERKLQERFVQRATGLYDDLRRMGYQIRTVVIRQELTQLPVPAREALGVERGIQIDRVRSVDGRILAFIRSFLREDLCPGLVDAELEDRSLYAYLAEEYDLRPRRGRRTVESVLAKGEIARHLELAEGEPLLLLRSASTAEDGEPLEWFEAWHRGDRTAFEIEILPGDEGIVSSVVLDEGASSLSPPASRADDLPARVAARHGEVLEAIRSSQVVAVLRAARYERPAAVASVLAEHGVPVVEFTLTGENGLEAIEQAASAGGAIVGAGSVLDASSARDAIAAGARFLVAPTRADQVVAAAAGEVPVIVAGLTPSEVWDAWRLTGMPVKIFPASIGGPDYLRSLAGPMPQVPLMPSGGVDASNVASFLQAGAVAVNVGGSLCPPAALEVGDLDELASRADVLRRAIDGAGD